MREKLVSIGLLAGERVAASKPLAEHVTDWTNALTAKTTARSRSPSLSSRVNKVFGGCGFRFFSDIAATKVQALLNDLRADTDEKRGISARPATST